MKKVFSLSVFGLVFLLAIGFVSARLAISEPDNIYNLGDKIYVSVEGIQGADSGNLNINLEK